MNKFTLQIVTPQGLLYEGEAEKIILRTTEGDVGILAKHADYIAALGTGAARLFSDGKERKATCSGGMVSVADGVVRVVASVFRWADEADAH